MRLFVSIDLPEPARRKLFSRLPDLEEWRKTPLQNIHLTLLFLGECGDTEAEQINRELREITFAPFQIVISGFGVFPDAEHPRVLWAGLRKQPRLMGLQREIRQRLPGFAKKDVPTSFVPHITLARKNTKSGVTDAVRNLMEENKPGPAVKVNGFRLKKSTLHPAGSIHQVLQTYPAIDPGNLIDDET